MTPIKSALMMISAAMLTAGFAMQPAAAAGPKNCPPGLAKKNNGCLPPGQAKKRYTVGEPLPSDIEIVLVPDSGLPPAGPGRIYARVDGDLLLIAEATRKVIEAVVLVDAASRAVSD